MEIAYCIGGHGTDANVLVKSLRRNDRALDPAAVSVPEPATYLELMRDLVNESRGQTLDPDAQALILERMADLPTPVRMVLANESFLCLPERATEGGRLYPLAHKAGWLRNLFADHRVSFFLCLRDPATFVPAVFRRQNRHRTLSSMLDGQDPRGFLWSDPVRTIRETCPDCDLTVWCYEDAPLIWYEVLCAVAGLPEDTHLHGIYDMARELMRHDGMVNLRSYVDKHPPVDATMRQRVTAAFIDRFGIEDELTVDPLPDWAPALMAELTAIYEADLARILAMGDVRVLSR